MNPYITVIKIKKNVENESIILANCLQHTK